MWVLDVNVLPSASLYGEDPPRPVLYAVDALSMELLWRSSPGQLYPTGKYNEPLVTDGKVFVGTDRIQAFGPGASMEHQGAKASRPRRERDALSPKASSAAVDITKGPALFEARCAACHDQERPDVPSLGELSGLEATDIVEKLTLGSMQVHVLGLDSDEVRMVAYWLEAGETAITPP